MKILSKGAVISPCGDYRYVLTRPIQQTTPAHKPCLFAMLNPSTADANTDDRTISRCIGFATAWGCSSLTVVNLFAYRSTNPAALLTVDDPHGPDNSHHIADQLDRHRNSLIIVAWGARRIAQNAPAQKAFRSTPVLCLQKTASGAPKHPLYVNGDTTPISWP